MYLNMTDGELTTTFENNLLDTNRGFSFYIDWTNVKLDKYSIEIHAMDVLIGEKERFDEKFSELLRKLPSVVQVFPFLFALAKAERDSIVKGKTTLKVIGDTIDGGDYNVYNFCCNSIDENQIKKYLDFFSKLGLKNLYQNIIEKSTYDYIIGVLVGLDSNGRKNRGGKAFELACEPAIKEICSRYDVIVHTQKQFKLLRTYGFQINEDIANRKADFILLKDSKCMNIEVNFYTGTGSKPEEIIDSYINRQSDLKANNIDFALITDGNCWKGTTNQLSKGFRHLSYLMNYSMCKNGMLAEIIENVFK